MGRKKKRDEGNRSLRDAFYLDGCLSQPRPHTCFAVRNRSTSIPTFHVYGTTVEHSISITHSQDDTLILISQLVNDPNLVVFNV